MLFSCFMDVKLLYCLCRLFRKVLILISLRLTVARIAEPGTPCAAPACSIRIEREGKSHYICSESTQRIDQRVQGR